MTRVKVTPFQPAHQLLSIRETGVSRDTGSRGTGSGKKEDIDN
jgi:hypothetical protein